MAGDWDAGPGTDLADLLTPLATQLTTLVPQPLQRFRRLVERRQPAGEQSTPSQARQNIHRHYDLSNDLFASFLDETLSYSSAMFEDGDDLATAQRRKIDAILDLAAVGPGRAMLEIGTGWGQLAIQAARRGAHVTTITLSTEQRDARRTARRRRPASRPGPNPPRRLSRGDRRLRRDRERRDDRSGRIALLARIYFATLDRLLRPGGRDRPAVDHHRPRPAARHPRLRTPGSTSTSSPAGSSPPSRPSRPRCGPTRRWRSSTDAISARTTRPRCSVGGTGSSRIGRRSLGTDSMTCSGGCGSSTSRTARPGSAPATSASASSPSKEREVT